MYASKVTRDVLEAAASVCGVRAEIDAVGRRFKVRLFPAERTILYSEGPKGGRRKYRARYHRRRLGFPQGTGEGTCHAICWHGFRDYFRAVYKRAPEASFRTALATYKDRDHFEATFGPTGYRNIGSKMYPVQIREACFCSDTFDDSEPLYPYASVSL